MSAAPRLLAATSSRHKLEELRRLFPAAAVVGFRDLADEGDDPERWREPPSAVVEDGATFAANACIKALSASRCHAGLVLADDSGLCVRALRGGPGVLSARHGGPGLDDRGRYELVLRQLEGVPRERRAAEYRAVLVLARAGRVLAVAEASCRGRILEQPRGDRGFGYDPVFEVGALGRSMAEMTPAEKDLHGHRGRAARLLAPSLAALLG